MKASLLCIKLQIRALRIELRLIVVLWLIHGDAVLEEAAAGFDLHIMDLFAHLLD